MTKTIIQDLDGCVFRSYGSLNQCMEHALDDDIMLPGVKEKFEEWFLNNYQIILFTGRPESWRQRTHDQIVKNGLWYDQLIMGVKHCPRYLINDARADGTPSAIAIELPKNEGLINVEI